jgi:LytS/YehU family sensor histidine kinase
VEIRVEVAVLEETLVLRVVNSIAPDKAHGRIGIGLANVRERLEVQFGARASFSAAATADPLWVAEIRMPLLRDGPDGARPAGASEP